MFKPTIASAAFALAILPGAASAFFAQNGLTVRGTGEGSFTVPFQGSPAIRDFWCAAGDYVVRDLHLPHNTRIYRLTPKPRKSGQGIDFSLSSDGAQPSGLIRFFGKDEGLSAAAARHFCEDPLFGFSED